MLHHPPCFIRRLAAVRRPLAAAVVLCLAGHGHAATIAVNDAGTGSVSGKCTLLDAVAAVNMQAAVNGCAAGDGANDTIDLTQFTTATTIAFAASSGTYGSNNQAVALALSKAASIAGPLDAGGNPLVTIQRSTVSGTQQFGLLSSSANLALNGLTLSNGYAPNGAGGVYSSGSQLSIAHSTITGNSGKVGGVYAKNYLSIADSVVSGNSGANAGGALAGNITESALSTVVTDSIFTGNSATSSASPAGGALSTYGGTITRSRFSNNIANEGGAVFHAGFKYNLVVSNSTFSGNSASVGGAIATLGKGLTLTGCTLNGNSASNYGGAVATAGATHVAVVNSTISGNSAANRGGGIAAYSASVSYSTIYGNTYTTSSGGKGAGLYFTHDATAYSSIITGNGRYDVGASTPTTSLGGSYDIIAYGVPAPANTISCNVKLGPLADFGGPTKTLPLLGGSCAIDAGPASPSVTTDQRGDPRPVKLTAATARADIGAFEKQSAADPDFIFINGFGPPGSD